MYFKSILVTFVTKINSWRPASLLLSWGWEKKNEVVQNSPPFFSFLLSLLNKAEMGLSWPNVFQHFLLAAHSLLRLSQNIRVKPGMRTLKRQASQRNTFVIDEFLSPHKFRKNVKGKGLKMIFYKSDLWRHVDMQIATCWHATNWSRCLLKWPKKISKVYVSIVT